MLKIIDSTLIRKSFAGTYLIEDSGEAALIEVSTSHALPHILNELNKNNISRSQIKYVFVTHIHLDHAGGAGTLLKELPNANLIVHPSGAKHMIDPSKLIHGAIAVYGEEVVKKDYGGILPICEKRIICCEDGQDFYIGNRKLTTIYTPGHARHHISILDTQTRGMFTGDSLGLSYPEMNIEGRKFYQPTTTPTAFEYDRMIESIEKMFKYNPEVIYFTHYGVSDEPLEVKRQILKRLNDYKELTFSIEEKGKKRVEKLKELLTYYYIKEAMEHGTKFSKKEIEKLFKIDINLNAMGLALWYERLTGL